VKKEIATVLAAVALAFGFIMGRMLPPHHYQIWGTRLLYDTATGKVCDPYRVFEEQASQAKADNTKQIDPDSPMGKALEARKLEADHAQQPLTQLDPTDPWAVKCASIKCRKG
jgi:hypothetical protein